MQHFFVIHRQDALNACCFMYVVAYIHCFNQTVQFLVQIKYIIIFSLCCNLKIVNINLQFVNEKVLIFPEDDK